MIKQKGSVLMLVLWVLIILSILSVSISYRASGDIKLAKYESDNIKARYLAKAGFVKMLAELNKDTNSYDSLDEGWNIRQELKLLGGAVAYSATDESSMLNLNGQGLIKENLAWLGLNDAVSQRILDYRAGKSGKGFEFIEELFLIDGMTKDIYDTIGPYVTIYRGKDSEVNINSAGEKVLNSVLTGNVSMVAAIIKERNKAPFERVKAIGERISELAGLPLFSVKSDFFRIRAEPFFSEDRKPIKAVVSVTDKKGNIYYWKEE